MVRGQLNSFWQSSQNTNTKDRMILTLIRKFTALNVYNNLLLLKLSGADLPCHCLGTPNTTFIT